MLPKIMPYENMVTTPSVLNHKMDYEEYCWHRYYHYDIPPPEEMRLKFEILKGKVFLALSQCYETLNGTTK